MVEWECYHILPRMAGILPTPKVRENECPRVTAYYQLGAGIDITLRSDISTNLDFMILDVKCEGSKHPPTCIINIYNQTELGESQVPDYTTDRLASVHLHLGSPMIIMGDWNLHHNLWDSTVTAESTPVRTQEVVDWLEGQSFTLCSEKDVHTRSGSGSQWDMVIDLTFTDETAFKQGVIQNH